MTDLFAGHTTTKANADLDAIIAGLMQVPGGRRILTSLQQYLKNNALFNLMDYGAFMDGVRSDSPALARAIADVPVSGGGTIVIPPGVANFGATTAWDDRCIQVVGAGSGIQPTAGTRVICAPGVTAFNPRNGSGGMGAKSRIAGLHLIGTDSGAGTNAGILLQASQATVEDVTIDGFGRNGLRILSSTGAPDATINANNCRVSGVRASLNYGDGFSVEGVDSNVCTFVGCDVSNNHGWGYYENSLLGNTYIAPHAAGNALGGYRIGNVTRSNRIVGGYKETDGLTGLQLDAPGAAANRLDFTQMEDPIIDNTTSKQNEIVVAAGGLHYSRLAVGSATDAEITLTHLLLQLLGGSQLQMNDVNKAFNWFMQVQADGRLQIVNAGGKAVWIANPLEVSGSITLDAGGVRIAQGGAAGTVGRASLTAGTVTIATTAVTANSDIHLTSQADSGTPGWLRVTSRVPATSFTVTSSNAADTSAFGWLLIERV